MTGITKVLSGLLTTTGISCAVSLPLSLKESSSFEEIKDLKIKKCESSEVLDGISVGEKVNSDICGKAVPMEREDQIDVTTETKDDARLNEFFKSMGEVNGAEKNYGIGQKECINNGKGGKLKDSKESEMVGYCRDLDFSDQNTIFVDISKNNTITNVRICSKGKDCWSDNFDLESISEFETKDAGEGQDISFFKER